MIIARGVAVGLLAAVSWLSHAEAGTLFGLQFRGNDTGLYALPTADGHPSADPSPIGGADVVPYEYASSAQSIAIGSTGLRRFRKVGASAMGKDGYQQDEARSATSYYNFVPDMGTQPNKVTQAEAISIDAQTGAVVVEEATIGPLLALQFSDKHGVATPADWREGKEAIIPPSVSDEDAKTRFPQGFTTLRPYLRTVKID